MRKNEWMPRTISAMVSQSGSEARMTRISRITDEVEHKSIQNRKTPLKMLNNPKHALLNQPIRLNHHDTDVARERVDNPLLIVVPPQTQAVHLSQNVQMTSLEHRSSHPMAIQSDGAVIKAKKVNGKLKESLDEQIADDLFLYKSIRKGIVGLNEMNFEFKRRSVRTRPSACV